MMDKKYLAHISEDREQTVYEHCENVSRYAELEASEYYGVARPLHTVK